MSKRRIFISFDHDDTEKVNGFLGLRAIINGFEFYIGHPWAGCGSNWSIQQSMRSRRN
jgi:hypothetical protein